MLKWFVDIKRDIHLTFAGHIKAFAAKPSSETFSDSSAMAGARREAFRGAMLTLLGKKSHQLSQEEQQQSAEITIDPSFSAVGLILPAL